MSHKFPIGTQYKSRGKQPQICTIEDQLTTTNSAGVAINREYVCSHEFCGQKVMEYHVCETTIAMGLLPNELDRPIDTRGFAKRGDRA